MILSIAEDNSVQDNTLGKALKKLEEKGIATDEDLNALIRKIYDYACNAGIRHGGTEPVTATEDEAIFVLVTCAATINYINMKYYGTH